VPTKAEEQRMNSLYKQARVYAQYGSIYSTNNAITEANALAIELGLERQEMTDVLEMAKKQHSNISREYHC